MKIVHIMAIASVLPWVCGPATGCTAIGHSVGQGIDGPTFKGVNSVTAIREIDSTGEEPHTRLRFESASLVALLREASTDHEGFVLRAATKPGLGFVDSAGKTQVEVITTYINGSFSGKTLIIDTVLAAELPFSSPQRYGLLRGDQVTLQFKEKGLAPTQGTVLRFGENHIVLCTGRQERGFPLSVVDKIFLGNATASTGLGLESLRKHIVSVPCLLLVDEPELIIPLEEVEQITVRVLDRWGPWSTRLAVAGGVIDLGLAVALVAFLSNVPSGPLIP